MSLPFKVAGEEEGCGDEKHGYSYHDAKCPAARGCAEYFVRFALNDNVVLLIAGIR